MKYLALIVLGVCIICSTLSAQSPEPASKPKPFVHPGLLHSRAELDFVKQKLADGEELRVVAWEQLKLGRFESRRRQRGPVAASLDYSPTPQADVVRGASNNPDIGSSEFSNDSIAAYAHALQWYMTDERPHANKSIEILNAWSQKLNSVSGHDARLLVGMAGMGYCNAAELIRHTDAGWLIEDQTRFETMLREKFYTVIQDFYPSANGNWDASMIQTMLAMGIFLNDRAMFDRAVNYYQTGEGNGAIRMYFNDFGECQESGRDQAHTQMGMGFLSCACEMAWKQGVDLYSAADNRLALGFEYTAKYNLGEEVPYEPYRSFEGRYHYRTLSSNARGRFAPIYDRLVHHFHDRRGLEMPFSRQVADQRRPDGTSTTHMPWGTLMFYGLPLGFNPIELK